MIECIPNFSEGRRREVIDEIAASIGGVRGVAVLDIHADADHNRSVITFAGAADAVGEAAFRAVRTAAARIDMTTQRGQHPRIGATDVVPFVPLRDATLEQCVAIARAVGRRIGSELAIPVYLYEAAATRPDRVALPDLRRGEYEGLREAITSDPQRAPDFGPAMLGPAGATVVGARPALIAYNIYLNTTDVGIARRIAVAVRGSSGGLRGVRALGLLVNGRAQVSMNLIDYRTTPLHRAVEMVAREAAAFGVAITESELVGLIPEDALFDAARFYLRLHAMHEDQVLERRLAQRLEVATKGTPAIATEPPAKKSWRHMVESLGAMAYELAGFSTSAAGLGALGYELLNLAEQEPEAGGVESSTRALLLVAQRAVEIAEALTVVPTAGADVRADDVIGAAYLAQAVAATTRRRALAITPRLDDSALRAALEQEFSAHVKRTRELVAQLDPQQ